MVGKGLVPIRQQEAELRYLKRQGNCRDSRQLSGSSPAPPLPRHWEARANGLLSSKVQAWARVLRLHEERRRASDETIVDQQRAH